MFIENGLSYFFLGVTTVVLAIVTLLEKPEKPESKESEPESPTPTPIPIPTLPEKEFGGKKKKIKKENQKK
jgi:hypothetical protein